MAASIGSMSDSELKLMAQALYNAINATPATFGLTAGYATDLQTLVETFSEKLDEHNEAQNTARARTASKENARDLLEAKVREGRVFARAAKVSDETYAMMGIPSGSTKAPSTATVPSTAVDTSERMRHKISWVDAATLDNKKKPRGVMGAEIWVKIDGPPPGDEKDCVFLTLDAFTPFVKDYSPSEANKTAHYMLRWRMRDGSVSAWGETVSATITG